MLTGPVIPACNQNGLYPRHTYHLLRYASVFDTRIGVVQAQKSKFAAATDREPVFWLRHDPVRMLDGDAPLGDAQVPEDARVELAVTFPGLELLPDSIANKVPDPSKGTPLQPPGAFTVSTLSCSLPAGHHKIWVEYRLVLWQIHGLLCAGNPVPGKTLPSKLVAPSQLCGAIDNHDQLDRNVPILQKKKDLTAGEGHVVLLEYLEEQPLLLARPGTCTCPDRLSRPGL